jgi:pimeloyl-ACP methyl ester carboxylesterase
MTKPRHALIAVLACAAILTVAAPAMAAGTSPAVPSAAQAPTDSFDEPVYLVKGYAPGKERPRCDSRWRTAISAFHKRGWIGQLVRVGFYAWDTPDTGCDVNLGDTDGDSATPPKGTRNTSIKELGRRLAWNIHNVYSSKGKSVDLVGHSMGGLIIRAALAGYQLHRHERRWPDVLYVEDVVTLGTPHDGTKDYVSLGCGTYERTRQCKEMVPRSPRGSGFLGWLRKAPNPQASGGTDWTLICSMADEIAPWRQSACASTTGAHHIVIYPIRYPRRPGDTGVKLSHSDLRTKASGKYWMHYWNHGDAYGYHFRSDGASPIKATQHALYWATRW